MRALLNAVSDRTKVLLSLDEGSVGVQDDGMPPAFAGQEYWAIHPGNVHNRANDTNDQLDLYHSVTVTLTRKLGYVPTDRIASDTLLSLTDGMYLRAELLVGMSGQPGLHMDNKTLDLVGGTDDQNSRTWAGGQIYSIPATVQGFCEPLRFRDMSLPQRKGPKWFAAGAGTTYPSGQKPTGMAIEIRFVDARRIAPWEQAT